MVQNQNRKKWHQYLLLFKQERNRCLQTVKFGVIQAQTMDSTTINQEQTAVPLDEPKQQQQVVATLEQDGKPMQEKKQPPGKVPIVMTQEMWYGKNGNAGSVPKVVFDLAKDKHVSSEVVMGNHEKKLGVADNVLKDNAVTAGYAGSWVDILTNSTNHNTNVRLHVTRTYVGKRVDSKAGSRVLKIEVEVSKDDKPIGFLWVGVYGPKEQGQKAEIAVHKGKVNTEGMEEWVRGEDI